MSRRVYIAGPMTGIAEHNAPAFDVVAKALRDWGVDPVSPPDITRANPMEGVGADGSISEATYAALVKLDIAALLTCNAMVLLDGWEKSKGAKREIDIALAIGLPIYRAEEFGPLATPLNLSSRVTVESHGRYNALAGAT